MTKKLTLTPADLKVIQQLLQDEYTRLSEDLADPADLSKVILPLVKINAKLSQASNTAQESIDAGREVSRLLGY
jgi:hypothetical protein